MDIDFSFFQEIIISAFIAYITTKGTIRTYRHEKLFEKQEVLYKKFLNIMLRIQKILLYNLIERLY